MKIHPFSVSVDGSNDTGLEKMNPMTIRIYDVNDGKIVTKFLDMCPTSSSTAEAIYSVVGYRSCFTVQILGVSAHLSVLTIPL